MLGSYLEYSGIDGGGRFLLDVGLGLRDGARKLEGDREAQRRYLHEIHCDWWGVGWTVPRVDDLGWSRYGCELKAQPHNRAKKNEKIRRGSERRSVSFCCRECEVRRAFRRAEAGGCSDDLLGDHESAATYSNPT